MNIRHLRYFIEVVSTGSLRRASEVLYVTQSALSRAVGELESELDCQLLERTQRGVAPTSQGRALLIRARRILQDVDALAEELQQAADQPVGHVRLAMPIGLRDRVIRPLVRKLRSDYPSVRIGIEDGNAHENRAAVLEGAADVAIIQELERGLPLNYRRLYVDPLCLVGPREAALKMDKPLPVSALAGKPLILVRAPNQIRWVVDAALRKLKARTEPIMELSSSQLMLDLVRDGHGYTVLPQSVVADAVQQRMVSAAPLGTLKVTWVAAWPKGKTLSQSVQITLDALLAIA